MTLNARAEKLCERLLDKKGSVYFNLNPWYVLDVKLTANQNDLKKAYRKLSLIVHPDKNQDSERARDCFTIVNKAYTKLTDEVKRIYCDDVVEDANRRMNLKILNLKSQGKDLETDPDVLDEQLMKTVFKIFAEREQRKKQQEKARQREEKQKREGQTLLLQDLEERKKEKELWDEGETQRIDNWKNWKKVTKKKKGKRDIKVASLKPPKPTNLKGKPPPPRGPPPVDKTIRLAKIRNALGVNTSPPAPAPTPTPPPSNRPPPPPQPPGSAPPNPTDRHTRGNSRGRDDRSRRSSRERYSRDNRDYRSRDRSDDYRNSRDRYDDYRSSRRRSRSRSPGRYKRARY